MSATPAARARVRRTPAATTLPIISVVPTPAPVRGLAATIVVCLALFVGALGLVFGLNTAMVDGAYQTQRLQVTLNDLADERNMLTSEIADKSTTASLMEEASGMGLVPAQHIRHIDLGTGVVTGGFELGK